LRDSSDGILTGGYGCAAGRAALYARLTFEAGSTFVSICGSDFNPLFSIEFKSILDDLALHDA
jgi:hypothetical protein